MDPVEESAPFPGAEDDERSVSATAARVAAYRLGFDRVPSDHGDPAADDALAADVASPVAATDGPMARHLQARTAFFDRVVVAALAGDVAQIVNVGAGYDGRAWRYAKPGVTWWEVDHPSTQADKQARLARLGIDPAPVVFVGRDLGRPGLADAVLAAGFRPDLPSLLVCEGVAVYLPTPVLERLLGELRTLAGVGTRLALSMATAPADADGAARRDRFRQAVAQLGEPVLNRLTTADLPDLFRRSRWQLLESSERAQRAGFAIAVPASQPNEP